MPVLSINKPLEQGEPLLLVENRLAVGRHRFSLVVTDNDGQESDPVVFTVIVRQPTVLPPVVPPVIGPVVRPPVSPVVTPLITPVRPRPRGPRK